MISSFAHTRRQLVLLKLLIKLRNSFQEFKSLLMFSLYSNKFRPGSVQLRDLQTIRRKSFNQWTLTRPGRKMLNSKVGEQTCWLVFENVSN